MMSRIHQEDRIPFEEPITIKCVVENKKLLAKVTAQTMDPIQTGFFVEFSDGTNIVATGCEDAGKFEADSPLYAPYIDAIQMELLGFSMVMDSDWYKFEIRHKDENMLVWVSEKGDKEYNYTIYFNGAYQFELKEKNGEWQSRLIRVVEPNPIDPDIVGLVGKELKAIAK